jgi:Icc protein
MDEINVEVLEDEDGIDRRGFLKCMAWAGTGVLWTLHGGILQGINLGQLANNPLALSNAAKADFSFVQISDSHIGFNKAANTDVTATLTEAVAKFKTLARAPEFLIHTGDLSHLSKPEEFDTVDQVLKGSVKKAFFVPGEHDFLDDGGKIYLDRYGKGTHGSGWYSFDIRGIHYVGLVNVVNLKAGGLGQLGADQLAWLQKDLAGLSASTPIVVFAHIPLWSVYPEWGWGTDDAGQALTYLKRFGSVTVLNGHIHQVLQKVEGNITFHTAASTAFPQPKPGEAAGPGPVKVDPGLLRQYLGVTDVNYVAKNRSLAVIDMPLAVASVSGGVIVSGGGSSVPSSAPAGGTSISIDNFSFSPSPLTIAAGATVTWTNHDDIPHNVMSTDNSFPKSKVLDTNDKFSYKFERPGIYSYFCGIHPHMTGKVIVK